MAASSNPGTNVPLAAELSGFDEGDRRAYIPEPPNEEEKRAIWKSQVLIPFSVDSAMHAILGPIKKFPKDYEDFHPSIKGDELILAFRAKYNMPFLPSPLRAFRSAPPDPNAENQAYLKWVNRLEVAKGDLWKQLGIFDLIQLSKTPMVYNPAMLLSSFYFWERATNCFHVPFGMITPTLLDVAAITGLSPLGTAFNAQLEPKTTVSIPTKVMAFGPFVDLHSVKTGPVSDAEHVAFLLYWLSAHVFCTKSLRVPAKLLPLATLLHEGHDIALGKLVLGSLYQSLNEVVADLRDDKVTSLNAAGPLWLLQLWLNAIFESSLSRKPEGLAAISREIDGHRLLSFTPPYSAEHFEADFRTYFTLFQQLEDHQPSLSIYSLSKYGPSWLRESYPSSPQGNNPDNILLWRTFLSPQALTVGFAKSDYTLCAYNPQLFSRQFGLSQILPNTLFDKDCILYPGRISSAKDF